MVEKRDVNGKAKYGAKKWVVIKWLDQMEDVGLLKNGK